jgi:hypothetical protein
LEAELSKVPPIDVIELAVEPRRIGNLPCEVGGVAQPCWEYGEFARRNGGVAEGDGRSKLSIEVLREGEDMFFVRWSAVFAWRHLREAEV